MNSALLQNFFHYAGLLFFFLAMGSPLALAQITEPPDPCTDGSQNTCTCINSPVLCTIDDLDGYFYEMTTYLHPTDGPHGANFMCPGFPGTVSHNPTWFAFPAWCVDLELQVSWDNCTPNWSQGGCLGIQSAVYSECFGCPPPDCFGGSWNANDHDPPPYTYAVGCDVGNCGPASGTAIVSMTGLTIGKLYYFLVDGCCGAACDVTINVVGTCGNPGIEDYDEPISGEEFVCVGDTETYQVGVATGANTYIWSINGTAVAKTDEPEYTRTWLTPGIHELCVEALNEPCIEEPDPPIVTCFEIEVFGPDVGDLIIDPNPLCPGETATITAVDYEVNPGLELVLIITDNAGVVLSVTYGDETTFTHPECDIFSVYSYQYIIADDPDIPEVGEVFNPPDCDIDCCDWELDLLIFEDEEAPVFTDPPADLTLECVELLEDMEDLDWTDNCMDPGITEGDETGSATLCDGGTITRTWTVTDSCDNTATHVQTITVLPLEPPVFINPPDDINLTCEDVPPDPPVLDYTNGLTGDCEISGSADAMQSGSFDVCGGVVEYTWSYTDICGEEITHTQTITVDPPPEPEWIDPPDDLTITCDEIPSDPPVLQYTNGFTGDCEIAGQVTAVVDEDLDLCGGTITYTWDFTDVCGNEINHVQVLTVEPAEPADFIDPPADLTVSCEDIPTGAPDLSYTNGLSGICEIEGTVPATMTGSADLCGGTIVFTWSFTDDCGREIDHVQTITVDPVPEAQFIDPPADMIITCDEIPTGAPDLNYTNGLSGDCEISGAAVATMDGMADLCGGTIVFTWSFTDDCGRETVHSQTLTVEPVPPADFIDPPADATITCGDIPTDVPDLEFTNNLDGDCEISGTTAGVIDNNADLCGGTVIITWSHTDVCGNEISHIQTLTVEPVPQAEFVDAPDSYNTDCTDLPGDPIDLEFTNNLDGDCEISGFVSPDVAGEVDVCGGEVTYTWTYEDPCGNEISHTQTITVDPIPQADFVDPPDSYNTDCTDLPGDPVDLEFTNNLDGDCEISGFVSPEVVGEVDVCGSEITYTWTHEDQCGNEISHTQTITVDPIPQADFVDPPDSYNTDCTDLPGDPIDLEFTNNLDGDCEISGFVSPEVVGEVDVCGSEITYTWTHEDQCGNEISHTQTITVDPIPQAEFVDPPDSYNTDCTDLPGDPVDLEFTNNLDGDCEISGFVSPEVVGEVDVCGSEITYTWTHEDQCGNEISHTQTITVDPIPQADFVDPPDSYNTDCTDLPGDPVDLEFTNNLDGDCEISGFVSPEVDGEVDICGSEITYTWTHEDQCGNEISHTQTITVDPIPQADFVDPPDSYNTDCTDLPGDPVDLEFTNNLDGDCEISGFVSPEVDGEVDVCGSEITYTWTHEDQCGNEISHTQTITVDPIPQADFVDPPESLNTDCTDLPGDPIDLEFTNNLDGDCEISGFVSPEVDGEVDICGSEITYTWTHEDQCGNEISHTQTITVDPIPQAEFVDPPDSYNTDCTDLPGDPVDLEFTNNLDGDCEISGFVSPEVDGEVDICGSEITYTWTHEDQCGNEISHTQTITVDPIPQAEFVDPPDDVTVTCGNLPPEAPELDYSNGLDGDCEVSGSVVPETEGDINACGSEITYTWTFEDPCGVEFSHTQTITIEPIPPAEFIDPPANVTVTCGNLPPEAPELEYTNNLDGDCEISGIVTPETDGDVDICGSVITYTWTFTDDCDREISHTQVITVEPIPQAEFESFPPDIFLTCGDLIEDPPTINYSNGLTGDCSIEGSALAVRTGSIDNCGGVLTDTWSFTDDCGREIVYSRNITVDPAPMAEFVAPPADIQLSCAESAADPDPLFYTNGLSGDCLIEGEVDAVIDGSIGVCGGVLTYTWTFTDACGRTISYIQEVTQDPADLAEFIDPPGDLTISCDEVIIDPPDLSYTNNAGVPECLIEGTVSAQIFNNINYCGGDLIYLWEFTDFCGRVIQYEQVITVEPASEAEFIDPPDDVQVPCAQFPPVDIPLAYTNNQVGDCEISGSVMPEVIGSYDGCGGEVILLYSFTDDCGRQIEHLQSVFAEPAEQPEFIDFFNQETISCEEALPFFNNPPPMDYTNNTTGPCELSGTIIPVMDGVWDECGGEIVLTWSEDICGVLLEYSHTVIVEPAPSAEFIDLPEEPVLECGDPLPDPFPLNYENGRESPCAIEGSIDPEIEFIGNVAVYTWSFTDQCGHLIEHIWELEAFPAPDISIDPSVVFICAGDNFDLESLTIEDQNNTNPTITFHSDSPPDPGNELSDPVISPEENTNIYILASTGDDCEQILVFTIQVDEYNSAGEDGAGQFCFGDVNDVDLWSFLGGDFDGGGLWLDIDNTDVNLNDPSSVNFGGIPPGIYLFNYTFGPTGGCQGDTSEVSIELLPEIELQIDNIVCSEDNDVYEVSFSTGDYQLAVSTGNLSDEGSGNYLVSDIDAGIDLVITASIDGTNCSQEFNINAPDCECPNVPAPISGGNFTICVGDSIPLLSVTLPSDSTIANWYDSPTGGTLLAEDTLNYLPNVSDPGNYRFYVESQHIEFPNCVSPVRTVVMLDILSGPNVNDAVLEACDNDNTGFSEFILDEAIPQISGNPNHTFSFHLTEPEALAGENPIPTPFTNTESGGQTLFVNVTNTNGCTSIAELELIVLPAIEVETMTQSPTCIDGQDGSVSISASGPFDNFEYSLDSENWSQDPFIDGLGEGNYTLFVRDEEGCTAEAEFEIGTGLALELTSFSAECDPNNTPENPDDDFYVITFTLNHNQGDTGTYEVEIDPSVYGPFDYNQSQEIILPADGQTHTVVFTDTETGCEIEQELGPLNSCSEDCLIQINDIQLSCNDNATPAEPEDDFYTIEFNTSVFNAGDDSLFIVILNGSPIDTLSYGQAVEFTLPADGSQALIEVIDFNDPDCSASFQTDLLEPCSDQCLIDLVLNSLSCDNQGTEEDLLDDTFTAFVTATGVNNSAESWYIEGFPDSTFAYGEQVEIGEWLIADGPVTIVIVDSNAPACTAELTINPPPPCSEPCTIEASMVTLGECDNFGTGTDFTDDIFNVSFVVDSLEGNAFQFNVSWNGNSWGPFNYGEPINIDSLPANGDTLVLVIVDNTNSQCQLSIPVSQEPCSFDCEITISQIAASCNDNGTPSQPADDFYIINISTEVLNAGPDSAYIVLIDGIPVDTFSYSTTGEIEWPADGNSHLIEVVDLNNPDCSDSHTTDNLTPCSDECLIEIELNSVVCDNQGTNEDPLDDTFTAFVTATGLNNFASSWYVEGSPGTTFAYGESVEIGEWLIADGPVTIIIVDSNDSGCTAELTINPPPPCSTPCEIEAEDLVIGECNDNGTGAISEDDFFGISFVVIEIAGNTSEFIVTGIGMSWGPFEYGSTVTIDSLPADGSTLSLIITDADNPNCVTTIEVSRESCSSCDQSVNAGPDQLLTCEISEVQLNGTASEAGEYFWEGPDGFTSQEQQPLVDLPGTYVLTVVFEDLCEFTDEVQVGLDGDFPEIDAGENQELNCSIGLVTLSGSVVGSPDDFLFEWFYQDGSPVGQGTQIQASQAGIYTLEVTNPNNGCTSVAEVEVIADFTDIEGILIQAVDPLCDGESTGVIEIIQVEGGTPPISVSFNGEQTEQSIFPNLVAGSYTIELIDQNGCDFDTTVVLENPDPLTVDLGPNLTIAPEEEILIEAMVNIAPEDIQSIFWTIDGQPACDPCEELTLAFAGENNATIGITIIDVNGCEASDIIQINIIVERNVYIPNAFSPNEDGINDRFLVYGDEFVEEVEEIMIFDRWGTKLFERRNIPLNDQEFGWDGTYRDQKLNPGVFVYYIRVRFTDGVTEDFSGDLNLVE